MIPAEISLWGAMCKALGGTGQRAPTLRSVEWLGATLFYSPGDVQPA